MNALGEGDYSETLRDLAASFARPKAILVVSAHWETTTPEVLDVEQPATIHDFFGFPPELYRIRYAAPGAPTVAARVAELAGVQRSKNWGLDHGAWSVLRHMYPDADIPTTQLSLGRNLQPRQHFELGEKLKPLRADGTLILGSGNLVHNLRDFSWSEVAPVFPWAEKMDDRLAEAIGARDLDALIDFKGFDPDLVRRAVPTPEHYLPLLYVLGASDADEDIHFPFTAIQNGSIAMRSVRFG
jgi:4,5-DOPA dioxygenase extradiol